MDAGLLETFVKLTGCATSGVSVLAIAWGAYLLMKTPAASSSKERYRTILYFLAAAVAIAALAAVTTSFGTYFNHRKIVDLRTQNSMLAKDNQLMVEEAGKAKERAESLETERNNLAARCAAESKSLKTLNEQLDLTTRQRDFFRLKYIKTLKVQPKGRK